jgi:hypothetical protein
MTEPERLTLSEKRELIDNVAELFRRIAERLPGVQLVYITMFPRFITRCCREQGHLTREDILVINGYRKAVESEIVEELEEMSVQVVEWYDLLGWDSEPGLDELVKKDVVCSDGVHLTSKANAFAAYLCAVGSRRWRCSCGAVEGERRGGQSEKRTADATPLEQDLI